MATEKIVLQWMGDDEGYHAAPEDGRWLDDQGVPPDSRGTFMDLSVFAYWTDVTIGSILGQCLEAGVSVEFRHPTESERITAIHREQDNYRG